MERAPCPSSKASVGRPLELLKHLDANAKQPGGDKHAQQRIGRNHRKDVANQRCESTRRGSNGTHATRNSLLKSLLLSLGLMVAGPGIEPGAPGSDLGVLPMH